MVNRNENVRNENKWKKMKKSKNRIESEIIWLTRKKCKRDNKLKPEKRLIFKNKINNL